MRPLMLSVVAGAIALVGCSGAAGSPDRPADAVGTASSVQISEGVTEVLFEHAAGYEYFEGTTFVLDDQVPVTGEVTDASAILPGASLEVWTGPCAESFPVQCAVEYVRVEP